MTPMLRLKNIFETFQTLIGNGFKEAHLNKSSPKPAWVVGDFQGQEASWSTKGVESDFLKFFKVKFNADDYYSIGFRFYYIDIPEDEQKIQFSLKSGFKKDKLLNSKEFSVAEFKEIMKKVNNDLKTEENLSYYDVVDIICSQFIPEHINTIRKVHKNKSGRKTIRF